MKLRFTETVAEPGWAIPAGSVIVVENITPQIQRWITGGTVVVVREPDADLETPEDRQAFETAAKAAGRPFVPRLCPQGTVVCLGGGPSLTKEDVDTVRGKATVIAVNDAYRLAPWADVLYACDAKWWRWHKGVPEFAGLKYALDAADKQFPSDAGIQILENTGHEGIEPAPTGLRTGKNSGYQALNLAKHLGATRVILLGYDMELGPKSKSHWFGEHPDKIKPPVTTFLPYFAGAAAPLAAAGIEVINCSRRTALTCFPRVPLAEALAGLPVAEAVA